MKFSNILFLGLLVLFCLISCSEAGKKNGVKRGGKGGNGKNRGVGKQGGGKKKKGPKRRKNNKDDEEDDTTTKRGKKRGNKNKKNNKAKRKLNKKKTAKFGKKKGSRRQAEEKSAAYGKSEKKKNKGCRHPTAGTLGEGHVLANKVSGMAPCWQIHCRADGKKKKWMYEQMQCVSCKVGDVSYAVGYVSEHKCFGSGPTDPCYVMMCMQSGQFQKKRIPMRNQPFRDHNKWLKHSLCHGHRNTLQHSLEKQLCHIREFRLQFLTIDYSVIVFKFWYKWVL